MLLVLLVVVTTACQPFDPRLNTDETDIILEDDVNDAIINNFQMFSYNKSVLYWDIKSTSANIDNKRQRTYLEDISLTYYDANRNPTSFVISKRAIMETDTQNIQLLEDVVIRNVKGTVVSGQQFYWNNLTEKLTSEKKVTLSKKNGFSVVGTGFSANKNLEAIHFQAQVSGEVLEESKNEDDLFDVGF